MDFEECKRKLNELGKDMTFVKNEIGINDDNKAANEHDPEFKS